MAEREPSQKIQLGRVRLVRFDGHLTEAQVGARLEPVVAQPGPLRVVVDCSEMTGYDVQARDAFVAWHRQHRARLERVAIVTQNPVYHMVLGAMSLAAGMALRPFRERIDAERWARDT